MTPRGEPVQVRWWTLKRWFSVAVVLAVVLPMAVMHRIAFWLDEWIFPRLRAVRVTRPLFVVGPPRSGTTMLHRLLAGNRDVFTTFPMWELVLAPALCEKFVLRGIARLDRLVGSPGKKCLRWIEGCLTRSLENVHQTSLFLPEEDYLGLLPFNGCFLAVLMFPHSPWVWKLGNFSQELTESQQQRLIDVYEGLLRRHLYFRGQHLAVLSKNPTFCSWLPKLVVTFPDARFIGLVRSPNEVVPSQLSSIGDGLRFFGNDANDPQIRDAFLSLLSRYYAYVYEAIPNLPDDRGIIVEYVGLKTSSDRVVVECMERFGYECSAEYRLQLLDQTSAVSGYRSGHRYSLDQFGLSETEIQQRFHYPQVDSAASRKSNNDVVHV